MSNRGFDTESSSVPSSPVDDRTYNILQALTSALEALDAYDLYAQDDGDGSLFTDLARDHRRHAELLLDELRRSLGSTGEAAGSR